MNLFKKILSDDVFKHGSIYFIGLMSFNIMNYFFHFAMGRMLGPIDYGILGVLMSMAYIITAPLTTIQTVITKFTAQFRAQNLMEKVRSLFVQSVKKMFVFSIGVTLIFIVFSGNIADFFNIGDKYIIISFSLFFLLCFILAINRGILQGLEKFRALSFSFVLEGGVKLSLAILFVYFGFRIFGAIGAVILGTVSVFIFTSLLLKRPKKFQRVNSKEIYKYAIPVLISITIITLIQNIDVLLVKHYMPEFEAGLYVAVSTLSKIIFFATMSFSFVMFPKVAEKFSRGKEHFSIFKKSLLMVSAITIAALGLYLLFPKLVVLSLYGEAFVAGYTLLRVFGLSLAILSFSYLIINYFLSINKFKFIYFLTFIFILETALIVLYHGSLQEVVNILFITNAILLLYLIVDLIKNEIIPNRSSVQRRKNN